MSANDATVSCAMLGSSGSPGGNKKGLGDEWNMEGGWLASGEGPALSQTRGPAGGPAGVCWSPGDECEK